MCICLCVYIFVQTQAHIYYMCLAFLLGIIYCSLMYMSVVFKSASQTLVVFDWNNKVSKFSSHQCLQIT